MAVKIKINCDACQSVANRNPHDVHVNSAKYDTTWWTGVGQTGDRRNRRLCQRHFTRLLATFPTKYAISFTITRLR